MRACKIKSTFVVNVQFFCQQKNNKLMADFIFQKKKKTAEEKSGTNSRKCDLRGDDSVNVK